MLSGKVINSKDNSPVSDVSIYINNTTLGTKTNTNGNFELKLNQPGQYEIIISAIGFERYSGTFIVTQNTTLAPILLTEKTTELAVVTIKPDANWERYYAIFKQDFLGSSDEAKDCRILNPDILSFDYDAAKRELTGSSPDYLIVENKALGYRLRYQVSSYGREYKTHIVYYEGTALFEELTGTAPQKRRWEKNRLKAYLGSSMHFLRSVIAAQPDVEGFRVMRLIRPAATPEVPRPTQMLVSTPLDVNDYTRRTDQRGIFALKFKDYLYIMYTKKHDYNNAYKISDDQKDANHPVTIINFTDDHTLFDSNGIIMTPRTLLFEGVWGRTGVAALLPVNYAPTEKP
ncbi:carboxypeptidase-like regulatory domain-containing protein [Mucilaginibacter koreensis]